MEPIIRSGEVRCGYWTVHYEKFPVLVALTPTNKLTSDNLNPDNKMMMIVTHHMSRAEDYLTDGKSLYKLINLDGNSTFVSAFSNTKDYKPSVNIYAVEKCPKPGDWEDIIAVMKHSICNVMKDCKFVVFDES